VSLTIRGGRDIVARIKNAAELREIKRAMKTIAIHIKGQIAQYPKETAANQPGQKYWYERGYGTKYMRRDGSVGGRRTSETLGRKWTIGVRNSGLTFVIGNNVSYGPDVQDREKQMSFHKKTGWRTIQDVEKDEAALASKYLNEAAERSLE